MHFIILTSHSNEVEVEEQVVEWLSENNDMKRRDGIRAAYATFLLRVLHQAGFECTTFLNTDDWKKPIHGLHLFFASAVWLVLPECIKILRQY